MTLATWHQVRMGSRSKLKEEAMKIELHCHTRMSDGSLHFTELLELAV
ncbi:hypothetical protein [Paenibacillus sp. FSL R5-0345]